MDAIATEINNSLREEILGWRTPAEAFAEQLH